MFTINVGSLQKSKRRFEKAFMREVEDAMVSAGEHAKQHVSKHSDFKRRSANSLKDATKTKLVRLSNGRLIRVTSNKKHAPFIEYGTKPHIITPKRKSRLRFVWRGRVVYARKVRHPGTRPYKFLWKATHAAYRYAGNALGTAMTRAARKF